MIRPTGPTGLPSGALPAAIRAWADWVWRCAVLAARDNAKRGEADRDPWTQMTAAERRLLEAAKAAKVWEPPVVDRKKER